jgi:hypothetical protein
MSRTQSLEADEDRIRYSMDVGPCCSRSCSSFFPGRTLERSTADTKDSKKNTLKVQTLCFGRMILASHIKTGIAVQAAGFKWTKAHLLSVACFELMEGVLAAGDEPGESQPWSRRGLPYILGSASECQILPFCFLTKIVPEFSFMRTSIVGCMRVPAFESIMVLPFHLVGLEVASEGAWSVIGGLYPPATTLK